MPYVEGYGSWPFGEEWLWEAMATSYLPLLDVLERAPELTLSLTPVLCDQLDASGVPERFHDFLATTRVATHELDAAGCRSGGREDLAREIERSALDYVRAGARYEALGGDLLGALGRHAAWTSAATHAVLPLLATSAGVRLQLDTGIASHRARFGGAWRGGLWSPECAHAPWLDPLLEAAGVRATCVDLTDVFGLGCARHLRPLRSEAGPLLVPIDREIVELVWSDGGYPSKGAYRDSHRRTTHHHKPWRCDGGVYDPGDAHEQVLRDAADFVERVEARVAGGGLCVCALDTELLGHWWYEGVGWLGAVVDECRRRGVELVHLDDAVEDVEADPAPPLPVTTWGRPRDLSTWSGPKVADLAWRARAAELRAVAARHDLDAAAIRELLALQSSDWAFVVSQELAEPYGRERADLHHEAFAAALAGAPRAAGPRSIAPHATPAPLLAP
ncbi:MAG TPA: 1,4-alpha-glucan branching protein domain-containing protein [Solirubrobacteraceae bacterium]|nr:1,4-alpha-glucan branching protein domain-containing protein [Solirubrobacteraceae bacterium]